VLAVDDDHLYVKDAELLAEDGTRDKEAESSRREQRAEHEVIVPPTPA
jgi:hypothetical protein